MNKLILPLALTGAIVPLTLIGCGGGNGVGPAKTQTGPQTPQTPQAVALTPTTFTLGNGQRITLTGTRTGTALKGNLKVLAATAQPRLATGSQNVAFPFSIAIGEYGYTGTFTPPRGFDIKGDFGSFGNFNMSGQLQTATENGSYSLTTNGVTDTGILPATGNPPTPNATRTPAPPTGNFSVTPSTPITFTNVTAGSQLITTPITSFVQQGLRSGTFSTVTIPSTGGTYQQLGTSGSDSKPAPDLSGTVRNVAVSLTSTNPINPTASALKAGQEFDLKNNFLSALVQVTQVSISGGVKTLSWRANEGKVIIRALGANSATIEFKDARMFGFKGVSPDPEAGDFTLNGAITATGLEVETR